MKTKRERHLIYKKALKIAKDEPYGFFLCHVIADAVGRRYTDTFLEEFPEIWKHKPKRIGSSSRISTVWFYGDGGL